MEVLYARALCSFPQSTGCLSLPFHAFLGEENGYLLDQIEISYLPASSLLSTIRSDSIKLPQQAHGSQAKCTSFGHSYKDQLPFAVEEAHSVAEITSGATYLDEDASRKIFRTAAADASILHLATHGHFRADDPLFSGLAFVDGWQTTFDTFNLKTNASLVSNQISSFFLRCRNFWIGCVYEGRPSMSGWIKQPTRSVLKPFWEAKGKYALRMLYLPLLQN